MDQHRSGRTLTTVSATLIAVALSLPLRAQTLPDNSKVNSRDRAKGEATADQQKEDASDREIAQHIRRILVEDKALSSYAHNVKVIAQGGQVTLKGPVRSEQEKRTVEAAATDVAGAGHVTSEISIAPSKNGKP
jgi:osmotically-inducible protein OsmY